MPRFSVPDELAKAVDPAIISTADEVLEAHAGDKWHASHRPEVVVLARIDRRRLAHAGLRPHATGCR